MKKWIGLVLIVVAGLFLLSDWKSKKKEPAKVIEPRYEYGILVDSFNVIKAAVKQGQTLGEILYANHIDHPQIAEIVNKSKGIFDFTQINSGKEYTVICAKDTTEKAVYFIYQENPINYIVIDMTDSVDVYRKQKEVVTKTNIITGKIKEGEGLWHSISKQLGEKMAPGLVDVLANKIYAWSIDFFQTQIDDSFIVYFEEQYVEDEFIGIGKVFSASFTHKGKTINAIRFEENKDYIDYFDDKGNNLKSAFLKSPIDFARISSRFGGRKHPISGKWKNHAGTDYAAASGTPIKVTANGTVVHASTKGGYGNCVIVKHSEKFSTLYAHLSKFKSGAGKGSRVQQGDIIGYVGSTGYSTGPHLHYEFWIYGKQVDHLKQDLSNSEPVKKENTVAFEKVRDEYLKIMQDFVK